MFEQEIEEKTGIENVKELAKEASDSGAGLMTPGTKTKTAKKRGPYKKTKDKAEKQQKETQEKAVDLESPQPIEVPSSQVALGILEFASNTAAAVFETPHAKMRPEELDAGSKALGLVFDKYLPYAFAKYGPEIMLGTVLVPYSMRLFALHKLKKIEEMNRSFSNQNPPQQNKSFAEVVKTEVPPFSMHEARLEN